MSIDIEKLKARLNRSLERNKKKLENIEANKSNLSENGHWSLGYYRGAVSQIENTLDLIEEMED